ncbi:hypothetical protein [Hydrocarboniphaga sp.]|uniref:hypothetical protein n=1 Tax=Hydrocarboniphaga sp. TaxID=2033016 RepID=UPI003D14B3FD
MPEFERAMLWHQRLHRVRASRRRLLARVDGPDYASVRIIGARLDSRSSVPRLSATIESLRQKNPNRMMCRA